MQQQMPVFDAAALNLDDIKQQQSQFLTNSFTSGLDGLTPTAALECGNNHDTSNSHYGISSFHLNHEGSTPSAIPSPSGAPSGSGGAWNADWSFLSDQSTQNGGIWGNTSHGNSVDPVTSDTNEALLKQPWLTSNPASDVYQSTDELCKPQTSSRDITSDHSRHQTVSLSTSAVPSAGTASVQWQQGKDNAFQTFDQRTGGSVAAPSLSITSLPMEQSSQRRNMSEVSTDDIHAASRLLEPLVSPTQSNSNPIWKRRLDNARKPEVFHTLSDSQIVLQPVRSSAPDPYSFDFAPSSSTSKSHSFLPSTSQGNTNTSTHSAGTTLNNLNGFTEGGQMTKPENFGTFDLAQKPISDLVSDERAAVGVPPSLVSKRPLSQAQQDEKVAASSTFDPLLLTDTARGESVLSDVSFGSSSTGDLVPSFQDEELFSATVDRSRRKSLIIQAGLYHREEGSSHGELAEGDTTLNKARRTRKGVSASENIPRERRRGFSRDAQLSSSSTGRVGGNGKGIISKIVVAKGSGADGDPGDVEPGEASETRHVCPQPGCDKHFSTSGHARRHSRIHAALRPFECPHEGCGATFTRRDNCTQHQRACHKRQLVAHRIPEERAGCTGK